MIKRRKMASLLFYFILSFFFMEVIFRLSTAEGINPLGLTLSLVFSIPFAILFYIICNLFGKGLSYLLSCIVFLVLALIFSSQLIYYRFFRTFYSLYSAGNAAQIFDFWKDILALITKNALWITLFFLPALLFILFGWYLLTSRRTRRLSIILLVFLMALSHLAGLGIVYMSDRSQYSAFDLYFQNSYPTLSAERLGLLTTMRLDLQRLASGWAPQMEAAVPAVSTPSPEESVDRTDEQAPEEVLQPVEERAEEKKIEYNTMNIDFSQLVSNETDAAIKEMHQYFESVQPTTKNDYTGKYKGYNLIFLTAESFSPYAVREDVTPTLYKLVHQGYYFTDFYNPIWGVSTSDGEYVACTSLIPKSGVWSFYKSGSIYLPFVMGNQLKKLNYKTVAYHDHTYSYYRRDVSHPNMGYDYKALGKGLVVKKTWPESDVEMMEKTVPEYIGHQPFHAYYMTVSGHMQYSFTGNSMALKNKKYVEDLPYSEQAKAYIAAQIELDHALENLLQQLEKAGIANKTLIALSADHYPYGLDDATIDELAGHPVEKNFELYKSPFILYTEGMEPVTINKPCSSLDIIPTLSNLLGLEYDSRLLMGKDIFSDSDPLVIFSNRSFITDKGRYNAETKEFIPNDGITIDDDYVNKMSAFINNKFYYSARILETDYYKKVLKN